GAMHCDQATHTCVECTAGSQCASGVCLIGGVCQADTNTAYVDAQNGNAALTATCTQQDKCKTVAQGIATGRPFVRMSGAFSELGGMTTPANVSVTLVADPGTTYTRLDKGSGVVIAPGKNTHVTIQGLDISCAPLGTIGVAQ